VQIQQVQDLDALRRFHAVEAAASQHDYVALPADPFEELVPLLEAPEAAGNLVRMFVGLEGDEPVGVLSLRYPTLDNLDNGNAELAVHPAHRRQGHGRALLQYALDHVRAQGRSRLLLEAPWSTDGGDGPAFPLLRSLGAKPALDTHRRLLDLARHPVGPPPAVPEGYRLVQWVDRAPDDLLDGAAYLRGRMTLDAPLGELTIEQEKWDAARYREKEAQALARNRMLLGTAVVHEASGAVAGITDIGVNRELHEVAYQWDTIVDPDHRGRRLGLLVKAWNHRLLVRTCPTAAFVNTWNATSNTYMVAVNDALGFEPAEKWTEWELDLSPGAPRLRSGR
jgi:GNAT superfamily N-acetyltransferase